MFIKRITLKNRRNTKQMRMCFPMKQYILFLLIHWIQEKIVYTTPIHLPGYLHPSSFIKENTKPTIVFNNSLDFCISRFRNFPKIPDTEDYKTKHSNYLLILHLIIPWNFRQLYFWWLCLGYHWLLCKWKEIWAMKLFQLMVMQNWLSNLIFFIL